MPHGEQDPITSIGNLPLSSTITLKNVLGVPSFKVDLMSVIRITKYLHCSVTFFPYWCILQDLMTKNMIGLGKQRDRIYYLVALASEKSKHQPPSATTTSCRLPSSQVASPTALWHHRLGHLSSSRLDFMAKHLLNLSSQSNNLVMFVLLQNRVDFHFLLVQFHLLGLLN